jgi:hypothetical protein
MDFTTCGITYYTLHFTTYYYYCYLLLLLLVTFLLSCLLIKCKSNPRGSNEILIYKFEHECLNKLHYDLFGCLLWASILDIRWHWGPNTLSSNVWRVKVFELDIRHQYLGPGPQGKKKRRPISRGTARHCLAFAPPRTGSASARLLSPLVSTRAKQGSAAAAKVPRPTALPPFFSALSRLPPDLQSRRSSSFYGSRSSLTFPSHIFFSKDLVVLRPPAQVLSVLRWASSGCSTLQFPPLELIAVAFGMCSPLSMCAPRCQFVKYFVMWQRVCILC